MKTKSLKTLHLLVQIELYVVLILIFGSQLIVYYLGVKGQYSLLSVLLLLGVLWVGHRYFKAYLKKELLKTFKQYLEDWIDNRSSDLPSKNALETLFKEFQGKLIWGTLKSVWDRDNLSFLKEHDEVLKLVFFHTIYGKISVYELYTVDRPIGLGNFKPDTQTRILLQFMPLKDLMNVLPSRFQLTHLHFKILEKRSTEIGDLSKVLQQCIDYNQCISVDNQLMGVLLKELVPLVDYDLAEIFVAYLIKREWEDPQLVRNYKKRTKVFIWYINQITQTSEFYDYWPKVEGEEVQILIKSFGKDFTDKLFLKQGLLSVASDQAIKEAYNKHFEAGNTIPHDILSEVRKRFFN